MVNKDKLLHAANVLICGAALTVADGVTGGAAAAMTGILSWREVSRRKTPPMQEFARRVQATLTELTQGRTADDPQYHLPDMILFSDLKPADVLASRWDAEALAGALYDRAANRHPTYRTDAYRTVFVREVGAILTGVMKDPQMADVVAPVFQNAVIEALRLQARELGEIKETLGSLEAALKKPGALTRAQLVALARLFGIDDAADYSDAKLQADLEAKAQEYASYKARIDAIDERTEGLGDLKAAAQKAAARLDFAEVKRLLSLVNETETAIVAETRELLARNALLAGDVQEAADYFADTADLFRRIDPMECARRRCVYADDLYDHGFRYGSSGLESAAILYRAALDIYSFDQHPDIWAATQNNLGNALVEQGVRAGGSDGALPLKQGVAAYLEALTVRSFAKTPLEWAMTQNNLGAALWNQALLSDGAAAARLLGQSIDAYVAASEVYTLDEYPTEWAATQNNIGNVLVQMSARIGGVESAQLLGRAIEIFHMALEVRARDEDRGNWAETQLNLAVAEMAQAAQTGCADPLARLTAALAHVDAALEVFDPEHRYHHYTKATKQRAIILERIEAARSDG